MNWMERAEQELEEDLAAGVITVKEYNQGMHDIYAESQEAYNNY